MAQLSNDCFAFGGELMRAEEALRILAARVSVIGAPEAIALADACGRILTEDLSAARNVPPHDNAAVDGYAVHFDDLNPAGETLLPVRGRVAAGRVATEAVPRGTALRVFTGAALPAGPDTCFMQEDCRIKGDAVVLPPVPL